MMVGFRYVEYRIHKDCRFNQTIHITYLGTNKNKKVKGLEFCKVNLFATKQSLSV